MTRTELHYHCYPLTENCIAGEYPFKRTVAEGLPKLKMLLDAGIMHFIDLTEPPDRLTTYSEHLPEGIEHIRFPTVDMTVPDFAHLREIHTMIAKTHRHKKMYYHCKGGFDRTGVVTATYFIFQGKTPAQAKQMYIQTVPDKIRARYGRMYLPLIERTGYAALKQYEQFLKR